MSLTKQYERGEISVRHTILNWWLTDFGRVVHFSLIDGTA